MRVWVGIGVGQVFECFRAWVFAFLVNHLTRPDLWKYKVVVLENLLGRMRVRLVFPCFAKP